MKTVSILLASLALATTVILAQKAKTVGHLKDKNGTFAIDGITSQLTEGNVDKTSFDFAGKPLTGYSKKQGLNFSAGRIKGIMLSANGTSTLETATLTGNVLVVSRTESSRGKSEDRIQSARVEFKDSPSGPVIKLPGAFTYSSAITGPATDQVMVLRAPGGEVSLFPFKSQASMPLQHAVLSGPIVLTIKTTKSGDKGAVTQNIKAKGDHLVFDHSSRTLVLSQNVSVDGDQSQDGNVFYGTLTGETLTIKLNDKMEMSGYSFSGPGDGSIRSDGGGGRR